MMMWCPNPGQMLVSEYGWESGLVYERRHDRTDGTVRWFVTVPSDALDAYAEAFAAQPNTFEPPEGLAWIEVVDPVRRSGLERK